ncbi:short chain dehydrogenase [Salinisphaera dokdonensis CL-ES53]|uniref:Short chain dehydrogenase n=1 Tax=Salinisphaera dokdonensis CL-ES53 TaxID=1304272 RepID=A0ABV2AWV3_9GAMM
MTRVLITGAASGLGWALAQRFFAGGADVILVDIDRQRLLERAADLAAAAPERIHHYAVDLTDDKAVAELIAAIEADIGGLDVLINNAGITHRSLACQTDMAVLRQVMAVDWQAPVALTLALMPLLRASRGQIINIGSMAGWMPVLGRAGYCSAKAALGQFFETLRGEIAADGVSILMVYPSFLDTPIETNALGGDGRPAAHKRSTVGSIRSAGWMAERIVTAAKKRERRLFPDRLTWFSSLLWRLAPDLYQHLMTRKLASELEPR